GSAGRRPEAIQIRFRPRHRIMEELAGLSKPKTIEGARCRFRDQDISRKLDQRPVPPWLSSTSAPPNVLKEARFGGIPVVIEDPLAAIDEHVVAPISGRGLDPDCPHTRRTPTLQEGVGEDVASAAREKDTVW